MTKTVRSRKQDVAHIICLALTAALFQVLFVLAVATFRDTWSEVLYFLALTGGTVVNAVLLSVDYITYFLNKQIVYRFCIIAYILLIFAAAMLTRYWKQGLLRCCGTQNNLKNIWRDQEAGWLFCLFCFSLHRLCFCPFRVP